MSFCKFQGNQSCFHVVVCVLPFSIDDVRDHLQKFLNDAHQLLSGDREPIVELCLLCVQCLEVCKTELCVLCHHAQTFIVSTADSLLWYLIISLPNECFYQIADSYVSLDFYQSMALRLLS